MSTITTRELLDLQAHLQVENTNVATFNHYARECTDPQLKSYCQEISRRRMQAFQMLSGTLGNNIQ